MKSKKEKMQDLQVKRRHKLSIQKKAITQDEWGNDIEDWTDWKTVTAKRLELFGSDYYAAMQQGEEKTIKWKIKYVAAFSEEVNTNNYRIINVRTDEIFDIKDTDYLNDDGQWFVLKCKKVNADVKSNKD